MLHDEKRQKAPPYEFRKTDDYVKFRNDFQKAFSEYQDTTEQPPNRVLLNYDKLIDYAMQELGCMATENFDNTTLTTMINFMINGYTQTFNKPNIAKPPVDFTKWNPQPTEQQLNAMRYIAQKAATVFSAHKVDPQRAAKIAEHAYVPYVFFQINSYGRGLYGTTYRTKCYQISDLLNAAISELINIAINPEIKVSTNADEIGPTQGLAQGLVLIKHRNDRDLIVVNAAKKLSKPGVTSQQRKKIALEALAALYPEEAALSKQTRAGYSTTNAVTEMRKKGAEIAEKIAKERKAQINVNTNRNKTGPFLSKFDIAQANLRAQATIIAENLERDRPGLSIQNNKTVMHNFIYNLTRCMTAEVEQNPELLLQDMDNSAHQLVQQWSPNLISRIDSTIGRDALKTHDDDKAPKERSFTIMGTLTVISKNVRVLSEHLQYLDTNGQGGQKAPDNTPYANYTTQQTIEALDVLYDCAIEAKRATIALCKSRLQTVTYPEEEKTAFALRIKEHEIALATGQFLLEGKNTQVLRAASIYRTLGGMAGLILGAGATAGITAAVSETAREALLELLKGSPEKFLEGLAAGNPVLVMTIFASIIGITGFAVGAFLAGETEVDNHVSGDIQEHFTAFALIQLAEMNLFEKQEKIKQ